MGRIGTTLPNGTKSSEEMLRDRLGEYYACRGLAFTVAVISLSKIHCDFYYPWNFFQSDGIFYGGVRVFDRTVLGLQCGYENCTMPSRPDSFHKYLCQFLADSSRSRQYALTNEFYAEAALYLYHCIYRGHLHDIHEKDILFTTAQLLNTLERLFDHASKSQKLVHKITSHHARFMCAIKQLDIHEGNGVYNSEDDDDSKDDNTWLEDIVANWDQVVVPGPRSPNKKRAQYIIAKYIRWIKSQ